MDDYVAFGDELENPRDDSSRLQLIANMLLRPIIIYSSDNSDFFRQFDPENHKSQLNPFELVKNDATQEYHLKFTYKTNKTVLDDMKLNAVLAKFPILIDQIPLWLIEFVKCDLNAYLRGAEKNWIDGNELIQDKKNCLIQVSNAKEDYLKVPENDTLE